jgi:hypothetical protein
MAETVKVTLPRFITFNVKEQSIKADLSKMPPDMLTRACVYKFGGVVDASAGVTQKADARKASQARVDALVDGSWGLGGGGGPKLPSVTVAALDIARSSVGATAATVKEWRKAKDPIKAAASAIVARKHGRQFPAGLVAKVCDTLKSTAEARIVREREDVVDIDGLSVTPEAVDEAKAEADTE